jgi:hypothetical protein
MKIDLRLSTLAKEKLAAAGGDIAKAALAIDRELASKTFLRIALISWMLNEISVAADAKSDAKPADTDAEKAPASKAKEIKARRKDGTHRKPSGMPSSAQKASAVAAMTELSIGVFNRKLRGGHHLRTIKVRELRAIVYDSGHAAGSFINRGYEDAVDAILCRKLADHCVTSDPDLTVPDIVKEEIAARYFQESKIEAAKFIQNAAARIANDLSNPPPPPIEDAA